MINFDLNDVEARLLSEARRQASIYRSYARALDHPFDHSSPSADAMSLPEEADFPNVRQQLRDEVAETSGYDLMEALIYIEESKGAKPIFPRPDGADAFDTNLSKALLAAVGTDDQIKRWGKNFGFLAWGMTEPSAGSDPSAMRMTAVLDEAAGEWILDGEKIFISHVEEAAGILTLARVIANGEREGIGLFVVEKDRPGFTLGPQYAKLGIRNRDLASFSLQNYRVPLVNRLEGNLKSALNQFNGTRSLIAADALGSTSAALDIVREGLADGGIELDYGDLRSDSSFAATRLIELEAEYEAAYLTVLHARWMHQIGHPDKVQAGIAKIAAAGAARRVIPECLNLTGPNSTSKDYFLEQAMRDSRITDIYEGPGDVLRIMVARALLGYSARELN